MIEIRRAADRAVTTTPGVTTRHGFSSGAHYDPENLSFGRLVAHDLHVLAPGAGFDWHPHRALEIVSWVLSGVLIHDDAQAIRPGMVQHLSAGSGVEHAERNGGDGELRFVQLWLLGEPGEPAYRASESRSLELPGAHFEALRLDGRVSVPAAPFVHVYVAEGSATLDGSTLGAGDEARILDEAVTIEGVAEVLIIVERAV